MNEFFLKKKYWNFFSDNEEIVLINLHIFHLTLSVFIFTFTVYDFKISE